MHPTLEIGHRNAPNWQATGLAIFCTALAAGIVANDISYVILPVIFLFSFQKQYTSFSKRRKYLLFLTLSLIVFGSTKGYLAGHDLDHVMRFSAPLTVFFIFCLLPGISLMLLQKKYFITFVAFSLTVIFFLIIKSGNFSMSDGYMQAWTITYSSNAAVSTWHYFSMTFFVLIATQIFKDDINTKNMLFFIISSSALFMLYELTDTSAFYFSLFYVIFIIIYPNLSRIIFSKISMYLAIILIFDFFTFKILSTNIMQIVNIFGYDDAGNFLRIIQLDYFIKNVDIFGSGFGAKHDFPFEIDQARQLSQIIYPYASELPIINIIFNGGIFAATWFLLMYNYIVKLVQFESGSSNELKIRALAIGCSGVLVGSISNPFLFSPVSMLLLAVMFDAYDQLESGKASV